MVWGGRGANGDCVAPGRTRAGGVNGMNGMVVLMITVGNLVVILMQIGIGPQIILSF